MNKKIFGLLVAILAVSLMLTPLAIAKPGAIKSNGKFEYFELVCSGAASGDPERAWITPQNLVDPNENKTVHIRGAGWGTGDIPGEITELTVGGETFTTITDPYSVEYTTIYDLDTIRYADGNIRHVNIRLTDTVTVYDEVLEIGTIVLKIKAVIDFSGGLPPTYSGTVVGYGTEALKGVKISAIDIGVIGPELYQRIGTITGWPAEITNVI